MATTKAPGAVTFEPTAVYAAEGDKITVSATNVNSTWNSARTWTDNASKVTCGTATGTGKVQSFEITVSAGLSGDATLDLQWTD